MDNNEVFKKLLNLTGLCMMEDLTIQIFELADMEVSKSKIKGWRTDLENPRASFMSDDVLDRFFEGLFKYREIQAKNGMQVFNFPFRK